MLQAVSNAFKLPDLRKKMLFTLLILVIYRLAAHVPVPGVDAEALRQVFQQNQLLGMLNMFSGGAMSNYSVLAMGVYPFITAQIVLQLLTPIIPPLEALSKEGAAGRQKMNLFTHLVTIPLAFLQGFTQSSLPAQPMGAAVPVIRNFGFHAGAWLPTLSTLPTLTAGTMFAIWHGAPFLWCLIRIKHSIIILGGIVSGIPQNLGRLWVANPWATFI